MYTLSWPQNLGVCPRISEGYPFAHQLAWCHSTIFSYVGKVTSFYQISIPFTWLFLNLKQRAGNLTWWIPNKGDSPAAKWQLPDGAQLLSSAGFSFIPPGSSPAIICLLAYWIVSRPRFLELTTALHVNRKAFTEAGLSCGCEENFLGPLAVSWCWNLWGLKCCALDWCPCGLRSNETGCQGTLV